jgi:hypothetical protein
MGTPLYMSPEQTRGGAVDHRTDVYATGIILYETVTGETPFNAPSFFEVMSKQLTEPPPPFGSTTIIDPGLEQLIFQCLEKEPEARPQTMADVRDRLIALRDQAIRSGQGLFERPWDPRSESPASDVTHKDDGTDKQGRSPRARPVDAGYTVPDPRESQVMAVQQAAAPVAPPARSPLPLVLGGVIGVAAIAGVAFVALKKPPQPVALPPPSAPVPAPAPPEAKDGALILVTQSGVTVFLDEQKVAEGGPTIHLKAAPGHHQLKVTRPGFLPFSKDVVFVAGDTIGETATLDPEKAAPVPHTGGGHKKDPGPKPETPKQPNVPVTHDGTVNPFGN